MVFKNLCLHVLWIKVVSAWKGLTIWSGHYCVLHIVCYTHGWVNLSAGGFSYMCLGVFCDLHAVRMFVSAHSCHLLPDSHHHHHPTGLCARAHSSQGRSRRSCKFFLLDPPSLDPFITEFTPFFIITTTTTIIMPFLRFSNLSYDWSGQSKHYSHPFRSSALYKRNT